MYKQNRMKTTSINAGKYKEGETIEAKVRRILNNKEPITDGAPLIYTERKDGILPQYDIRADRFDLALETADTIHKTQLANRKNRIEKLKEGTKIDPKQEKNDGGAEPLQGTK